MEMPGFFPEFFSGVSKLVGQIVSKPEKEVIIENNTAVDLSFPVGRDYKKIIQGEITIHPELFFFSKAIKPGDRGMVRFQPTKKYVGMLHAALEMEVPNEGCPPDKLMIGASSQTSDVIVSWNVMGGLSRFLDLIPPQEPTQDLVVAEGYYSELSYDENTTCWKVVVHSRQPGTFGLNTRLQNQTIQNQAPLVSGDHNLILEFVNYTDNGLSLPPNFAHMSCGTVEKDVPYIQKELKSQVEFAGTPEFSGQIFVQVAPFEILVVSCCGTNGDTRMSIYFYDVNPNVEPLSLPANVRMPSRFCGETEDETINGRYCEALVTNVSRGIKAKATIAVYPRTPDDL